MDKYKRLASNTLLFAISQFLRPAISFIMQPLFTYWFATQEVNAVRNLATQVANLLIPLVSLGISNAVIRFGLEKSISKKQVFSNGIAAIGIGFCILLLAYPIMSLLPFGLKNYLILIYVYVLVSCLRTLCCQFCRAKQYTRLYAVDGIVCTFTTTLFYIFFIRFLNLGATGYLIAIICGDALSSLFLFVVAGLHKYIGFSRFNKKLFKDMLKYALPLVPASLFWWVTNASDQFFVSAMCGLEWNAIYTAAYVLPNLLALISSIFTEAWQLSAVIDGQDKGRERFFSKVFSAYQSVMFTAGAGLILLAQPFMSFSQKDYFVGWKFIPMLTIAMVFSALNTFFNSIYMVEKRSGLSLATMAVGAAANCVLNFLLIPKIGANGAAIATLLSYIIVFILRAINTRSLIKIKFQLGRLCLNLVLLFAMSIIMIKQVPYWFVWCSLLFIITAVFNVGNIMTTALKVLKRK